MGISNSGVPPSNHGTGVRSAVSSSLRCPRRLVRLCDTEDSEVEQVLIEYKDTEVSGKRLHADLQRLADEHRGQCIAAEWLSPLGWTRFLWCRRTAPEK